MGEADFERIKRLAGLTREEVGSREEEVKINFVVPLLEALGHSRLKFEHKNRDIVLREGLPPNAAVVVETKRYGEPLNRHTDQVARYALEERCPLAVLTNGDEVRIYAPLWPGAATFAEALVRLVRREALASPPETCELAKLLSAGALASGESARTVAGQQTRREQLRVQAEAIRGAARMQRDPLEARLRAVEGQLDELGRERQGLVARLAAVAKEESETLRGLYGAAGLLPPQCQIPDAKCQIGERKEGKEGGASSGAGPEPPGGREERRAEARTTNEEGQAEEFEREPWTDEELFGKQAEYQRRILGAFVRAGTRRLALRALSQATGLGPQQAWGALSAFTMPVKRGCKELFLRVEKLPRKPGQPSAAAVEIVEKYWEQVVRLYGGGS